MNNERLMVIDGIRTPFCKLGSDLSGFGADELGRVAVNALLTRTGLDPNRIDEVIFGCVGQPFEAANVARVIALRSGIPEHVPAMTVHRNCASGCEALTQAFEKMKAGRGSVFVIGGAPVQTLLRAQIFHPGESPVFRPENQGACLVSSLRLQTPDWLAARFDGSGVWDEHG